MSLVAHYLFFETTLQDTANKRNFKGKKNLLKEDLKQNIFLREIWLVPIAQ